MPKSVARGTLARRSSSIKLSGSAKAEGNEDAIMQEFRKVAGTIKEYAERFIQEQLQ